MDTPRLVFVYNADSGLFNTLTDIAHKAFSPQTYQCSLCAITHDLLSEKSEWRDFIASLDTPTEFLHKDEFRDRYGEIDTDFPVVFRADGGGLTAVLGPDELSSLNTVDSLRQKILELV